MKFRKKPVVIEAVQFKTNNEPIPINMNSIVAWVNEDKDEIVAWHDDTDIFINTLEGVMRAYVGDWIIKGVNGEFYQCKPDIFEKTYDAVVESEGE